MESSVTLINVINRGVDEGQMLPPEPLGCLYLLAYARQVGIAIRFVDFQTLDFTGTVNYTTADLWEYTCGHAKNILAISCMAHGLPLALSLSRYHKQRYPSAKIILGGPGPSGVAHRLAQSFSFIDYVVMGEGEVAFQKLLRHVLYDDELPQVNNKVVSEQVMDLSHLLKPDRTCIKQGAYNPAIMTARGCPFSCGFCASKTTWGNSVRVRSPQDRKSVV